MRVNYEEKVFENYFNAELRDYTKKVFSPGQYLEGNLGFDFMAYMPITYLHTLFDINQSLTGVEKKILESIVSQSLNNIPNFKANLFFQYKKPEYLTNANASEWSYWGKKYFRYEIYLEQQVLLEQLSAAIGNSGVVLYASPAIKDVQELYEKYYNTEIIDNTNFQLATNLIGHHHNTYTSAGRTSWACSEPQEVINFDFVNFLSENSDYYLKDISSNIEFIVTTAKRIEENFGEITQKYLGKRNERLEISESLYIIHNFCKFMGLDWKIKL